ncbi:hypothetical protein GOODEAATRI_011799 [Goodea atripinnis]|uniref:Uncharacterized protein n=1 Tax=Goodea atripinnis TaxID=208336 RepID=A0ABV0P5B7_9TELE
MFPLCHCSIYGCPLAKKRKTLDKQTPEPAAKRRPFITPCLGEEEEVTGAFSSYQNETIEVGWERKEQGEEDEEEENQYKPSGQSKLSPIQKDNNNNNSCTMGNAPREEYENYDELVAKSLLNLGKIAEDAAYQAMTESEMNSNSSNSGGEEDDDDEDDGSEQDDRHGDLSVDLDSDVVRETVDSLKLLAQGHGTMLPEDGYPESAVVNDGRGQGVRGQTEGGGEEVCLNSLECLRNQCFDLARKLSETPPSDRPILHSSYVQQAVDQHVLQHLNRYDTYPQEVQEDARPLERSYSEMLNLMKLEEQLSPASRGYSYSQEGDEDTTSVASDRSDDTFDMAKGNLSLLEKAIALESERAKVMRDRMISEHTMPRRDQHHHRIHGEHSPRHSTAAEERKSRMHPDGLKRAYYPKGRDTYKQTPTGTVLI